MRCPSCSIGGPALQNRLTAEQAKVLPAGIRRVANGTHYIFRCGACGLVYIKRTRHVVAVGFLDNPAVKGRWFSMDF